METEQTEQQTEQVEERGSGPGEARGEAGGGVEERAKIGRASCRERV